MADEEKDSAADQAVTMVAAIGELIKAAGDSEPGKQAAANFGQSAVILTETLVNCLLPLAALNYGVQKAKDYFSGMFREDLAGKIKNIPQDHIIEPKASIAGPILQGLTFTHEEEELKNLYLELLAASMDCERTSSAHPAFVEVIRQLTSEEAELLKDILLQRSVPICKLQLTYASGGKIDILNHLLDVMEDDKQMSFEPRHSAYVDNWSRLGLVSIGYDRWFNKDGSYEWAERRPELAAAKLKYTKPDITVNYQPGVMAITDFGRQFAKAVAILD